MNAKNVCRDRGFLPPQKRKNLLENYLLKQKDLTRKQRNYKKLLTTKTKSRNETILEANYFLTNDRLREEKNDLRADIWVATGAAHKHRIKEDLKSVQCHVDCQENLALDIKVYKTNILNMERAINCVNKDIYALNRKTVPETQHQEHVARSRKKLSILENELEMAVCRECGLMKANAQLKDELMDILKNRTFFNDSYAKLIARLNNDKKFLLDLIEYSANTFERLVEVYEKIDILNKREMKDNEARRIEMQAIIRKIMAIDETYDFMITKCKERKLDDLQPKEYRRREAFRIDHNKKISLFKTNVDKILKYTQCEEIDQVIEKFSEQENLYYTYFNYANEMSYHMTLLNNSVNSLYNEIATLRHRNYDTKEEQLNKCAHLKQRLIQKHKDNEQLQEKSDANDVYLNELLFGFEQLFEMVNADATPLTELLGYQKTVNLMNIRTVLKILEDRVNSILATVFITQMQDGQHTMEDITVKDLAKFCDWTTDLDDIVLTQQCPECAAGEAFNVDDADDGGIVIYTKEETIKRLKEKVDQPEMQYHLHTISQCRLPRSRQIVAKRHI